MKKNFSFIYLLAILSIFFSSGCSLLFDSSSNLDATRVALEIQATQFSLQQTQAALQPATTQPVAQEQVLPTYTPYPTYTIPGPELPTAQPTIQPSPEPTYEPTAEPTVIAFEDWKENAEILLYDNMYKYIDSGNMIFEAIDSLGLAPNTTNTKDAMGNFLAELNSSTEWDLIVLGGEAHDNISGEFFTAIADQVDKGASVVMEVWYLDNVFFGKVEGLFQRCGVDFHQDWQRPADANLNGYLIYLLDESDPIFSTPNTISMLIPSTSFWWVEDVGDTLEVEPGSNAKILAGIRQKEYNSYGVITKCMDGRMIWQTFDTHDYKYWDMIDLWENYITNALQARYDFIY